MDETSQPPSPDVAVKAVGLRKSFGWLEALRGVSFELKKGEFLAVFGPNGAGKTTLLKILSTLTRPTAGSAWVAGYDATKGDAELRKEIGVISHASSIYGDLTAFENMVFYARMYGVRDPETRAVEVVDEVGLKARLHDRAATFSRGMLQRLTIARAVIHNPSVLFLDEPYTGLDQHAAKSLTEQLAFLHTEKRALILTTHDIDRGLDTCDKAAIQVAGKFVRMDSIDEIDRKNFENLYLKTVRENS